MVLLLTSGGLAKSGLNKLARVEDDDGLLYATKVLSAPWSTDVSPTCQSPTLVKIEGAEDGYLAERVRVAVPKDGTSDLCPFIEREEVRALAAQIACSCRASAAWHTPQCAKQNACQRQR